MRIVLPKALNTWYEDFNPTDGEVALMVAVTLFARLFGVKTFQQWEVTDVRAFIRPKRANEVSSKTLLRDLQAQGALEYINDIDGIETIRLNPGLSIGDLGILDAVRTFEVQIKDEGVIMALSFFMGRMIDIHDGAQIKDMKISPKVKANGEIIKKYKLTKVVLPSFYTHQFRYFQTRHGEITE